MLLYVFGIEQKKMSFEVESILDSKVVKNRTKYLVKWVGYPEEEATWEPASYLRGCKEMIEEYEAKKKAQSSTNPPKEEEETEEQLKLSTDESDEEKPKENSKRETKQRKTPKSKNQVPRTKIISASKNQCGDIIYKVQFKDGEIKDVLDSEARIKYTKALITFFEENCLMK